MRSVRKVTEMCSRTYLAQPAAAAELMTQLLTHWKPARTPVEANARTEARAAKYFMISEDDESWANCKLCFE
jgi:hypothetical protein